MQTARFRLRPVPAPEYQEPGGGGRRTASGVQVIRIYSEQQKAPRQWKKFMSSGDNKEELIKLIFNSWRNADPQLLKGVEVFLMQMGKSCALKSENFTVTTKRRIHD